MQKAFTRKIPHKGQDYWDRLRTLRLYSLERRRERYRIIYIWKMLENLAPNLNSDSNQIRSYTSLRHGRRCVIPPVSTAVSPRVRALRDGSLAVHGSRLFNVLPQHLRNMTNVELPEFKKKLDEFLASVPDEPQCPGYTDLRKAESNSLLDMVQTLNHQ